MNKQQRAYQYIKENNLEKALQLLIEYTEEQPNEPIAFVNVADLLLQVKQYEQAERFYLKAIELDQTIATAFYGLGNVYYINELYDHAEKMFTNAHTLGLDNQDVYFMIGMTHIKQNNTLLALPFLQRAQELKKDVESLFQYGLALAKMNYINEAQEILTEVLELDALHTDALYNMGMIAIQQHKLVEGMTLLDQVLSEDKSHFLAKKAKEKLENGMDQV